MCFYLYYFLYIVVSSPVLAAIAKARIDTCSLDEYECGDGACVSIDHVCDGRIDCADGSDETCSSNIPFGDTVLHRSRRQATCRKNQWQCRDGTCIGFDGKCDGMVDCPDGSDETHALCRKTQCQFNWFRCTYGACADGTAPCNGIKECADNSDELLPRCRNETDEVRGQFKCLSGQSIPAANHCDGVPDCPDGSDETVRACAAKTCPSYLFQCAYGACVDAGSDCNDKTECADGSDESDELCNRTYTVPTTTKLPILGGSCILPEYPKHGSYAVAGVPDARPGQAFTVIQVNITCNPGYGVDGMDSLYCIDGMWSGDIPNCVRFCRLNTHPSVEYRCLITGDNTIEGSRECGPQEPAGTIVRPECRKPNYYASGVLPFMRCIDGSWDYVAICSPGQAKNGTNITILIKDKVEIYVNVFQYSVPIKSGTNTDSDSNKPVKPVTPNNDVYYDIDESDWRIGTPTNNKSTNANNINFNINNSSVVVKTDDRIVFVDN